MALQKLHVLNMQISRGCISALMAHDCLEMLDQLSDPWIFQITSLNAGASIEEGVWYPLLDAQFRKDGFEDGSHHGINIAAGKGGGYQRAFQGLHNSGLHTVPGFRSGESLSAHCLCPLRGLL